jgi:hypothetical protein
LRREGLYTSHISEWRNQRRRVVVPLRASSGDGFDELDIDLDLVAGQRLLVALPPPVVGLVTLVGREPVEVEAFEDPPHPRR